jgi:hypothetical protein
MTQTTDMTASPASIEALSALLDTERTSILRFMDEDSSHLTRATVTLRKKVDAMYRANARRVGQLVTTIESLGGSIRPPGVQREDQYLAFLTLQFMIPKLIEDKKRSIAAAERARTLLASAPELAAIVTMQLAQHQSELAALS